MGFFKKIFKGIKKVVKGIGKVVKKVVKSKAFKAIATVACAVFAPQLIPMVAQGLSTAGAFVANTIATGASAVWSGVQAAGSALMSGARAAGTGIRNFGGRVFQSITDTISNGVEFLQNTIGMKPTSKIIPKTGFNVEDFQVGAGGNEIFTSTGGHRPETDKFNEKFKERLKGEALNFAEQAITGAKQGGDDPTGQRAVQQFRYADEDIKVDTGAGYEQLASLGMGIQSPYLGYQQGQQLFGIRTA